MRRGREGSEPARADRTDAARRQQVPLLGEQPQREEREDERWDRDRAHDGEAEQAVKTSAGARGRRRPERDAGERRDREPDEPDGRGGRQRVAEHRERRLGGAERAKL